MDDLWKHCHSYKSAEIELLGCNNYVWHYARDVHACVHNLQVAIRHVVVVKGSYVHGCERENVVSLQLHW